jgi:hypothetical protein
MDIDVRYTAALLLILGCVKEELKRATPSVSYVPE